MLRARDTMDRNYAEPLDVPSLARTLMTAPGEARMSPYFCLGDPAR